MPYYFIPKGRCFSCIKRDSQKWTKIDFKLRMNLLPYGTFSFKTVL